MEFEFSEEEKILKEQARKLAREKIAPLTAEIEESKNMGPELIKIIAGQGLYALFIPKEYGGVGISAVRICILREELSKVSAQADLAFIYGGLGSYGITFAGNEEQRRKYLPRVAKGERIGAFALTEPDAGSDVANIQSKALLEGDHYIINGEKTFVTFADVADFWLVFAKTDPAKGRKGISLFIVEARMQGIELGEISLMAGLPEIRLRFANCKVPKGKFGGGGRRWLEYSSGSKFEPFPGDCRCSCFRHC